MRRKSQWLRVILALLSAMFFLAGCKGYKITGNNNDEFKNLYVTRGLGKFTFEYNAKYKVNNVSIRDTETGVFLFGPEAANNPDITILSISAAKLDNGESDYKSALEHSLALNAAEQRDFKIITRFSVTINGESGEEVEYSYIMDRPYEDKIKGLQPVPSITIKLMFAHNNLLWWLQADSLDSEADSTNADFDHIVQTFKLLP